MFLALSLAGVIASIGYYIGSSLSARRFAIRAETPPPPTPAVSPRVVLLKPLYNLSDAILSNLETFLAVDHPGFELVLGVPGSEIDAAGRLAELRARFPQHHISLVTAEEPGCANRKVARLIQMLEHAPDADVYVLSDADIRVEPDYLRRLLHELTSEKGVGVVTCAYRARPVGKLASRFEALMINTDFAPMVILAEAVEPVRQAFGATIAFKREVLSAIGGFRLLRDMLADDFFLGRHAIDHGFEIRLSSALVTIACDDNRFIDFWNHQLRWARTYRTARPLSIATIVTHGPFMGLLFVLASHASPASLAMLAIVLGTRLLTAVYTLRRVLRLPDLMGNLILLPVKDIVMTAIWFTSLCGNQVLWGGRRFRIMPGGSMREIEAQRGGRMREIEG